jgi:endonuclease YncB( thermonuclease family)
MTPATRIIAVVGVLAVAGAGAAAFVLTAKPPAASHPPSAPAAATPGPLPAAPPLANAPAADIATIEFNPLVRSYSLVRDSAAYSAASLTAPQFYPLRAGTGLMSAAISKDGAWVVAMTQDGQAACIPAADLGPYDPSKTPHVDNIDGPAQVIDTATLTVNGQTVTLEGLIGKGGDYAAGLQSVIDAQNQTVSCSFKTTGYVCLLQDGTDIARSSLYNGAAAAAPNASADYQQQELAAKTAQRGIWK